MTAICPAGHTSTSDDYCDVCGMPIPAAAAGSTPAPVTAPSVKPAGTICPSCSTENVAQALFCEACGYDFTTGTMPRPTSMATPTSPASGQQTADQTPSSAAASSGPAPPGAAQAEWVAEVWIDPDWYKVQESTETMPSPGLPEVVPLRNTSVLIGRTSKSRNITPDITCESDTGISRRQAQLTSDGKRWWVEDLDSSNGTYVGPASGPLPTDPIPVGPKTELDPDDRVYLGAWTRVVIRRATDEEKATL